jgi:hypothetical protein
LRPFFLYLLANIPTTMIDKDTTISNTFTLGATGLAVMNPIETLTIISLCVAIAANLIVVYKNLKKK